MTFMTNPFVSQFEQRPARAWRLQIDPPEISAPIVSAGSVDPAVHSWKTTPKREKREVVECLVLPLFGPAQPRG
jgi:hypothetical protein